LGADYAFLGSTVFTVDSMASKPATLIADLGKRRRNVFATLKSKMRASPEYEVVSYSTQSFSWRRLKDK
jgi:hypothetical protein